MGGREQESQKFGEKVNGQPPNGPVHFVPAQFNLESKLPLS